MARPKFAEKLNKVYWCLKVLEFHNRMKINLLPLLNIMIVCFNLYIYINTVARHIVYEGMELFHTQKTGLPSFLSKFKPGRVCCRRPGPYRAPKYGRPPFLCVSSDILLYFFPNFLFAQLVHFFPFDSL